MKHFAIHKLSKTLTLLLLIISGKLCYGDTVSIPFHYYQFGAMNGNTRFEYDSWNRMQKITYPDGEVVSYGYDGGGNLISMHGIKNDIEIPYIKEILYNEQGKRSSISYGNGARTRYKYDSRMRLDSLICTDNSNNVLQKIKYTYDKVDNITKVVNSGGTVNTLGGSYTYTHAYDEQNRLTESYGTYKNADSYSLVMGYTSAGKLEKKTNSKLSQNFTYAYCGDDKPHAPRRMLNYDNGYVTDLRWDEMGNLGQVNYYDNGGMWLQSRHIAWTEDCRITNIVDKGYHSYYTYDDGGERVLKLTGPSTVLDVNADIISYQSTLKNVTLYTSPYLVAHNKGYTKHFYAGSERVCAAIGEGGLNNLVQCIGNNQTLKNKTNNLFHNTIGAMGDRLLLENDECLRNDKNTPKELLAEFENVAVNVHLSGGVDAGTFHNAIDKYCSQDNANSAVYYYHSDHLGSASWITNKVGSPVQHLQYMPYGEPLVNEKTTSYEERFTFTGKERDSETGYGYFGARYYDSDFLTGWLSVDPMADKYPSLSPYAYCAWNPVKLVDPNGEEIKNAYEKYKNNNQIIQDLKNKKKNAETRQEKKQIQQQINNAEYYYDKYLKVEKMLSDFKSVDADDYDKLNNLIYNGVELDIIIYISDSKKSSVGGYGTTEADLSIDRENNRINISPIKITIYGAAFWGDTGKSTLANEFGDVIFLTTRPDKIYSERNLNYYQKTSTKFSFDYEDYIDNPSRNKKPNPYDY